MLLSFSAFAQSTQTKFTSQRSLYKEEMARCQQRYELCSKRFAGKTMAIQQKHCDGEYTACMNTAKKVHSK